MIAERLKTYLRLLEMRKVWENLKIEFTHSLVHSLPSKSKNSATKFYMKVLH